MPIKIDGINGVLQSYDYQAPTTGFSYTFASGTTNLIMQPAGTLASGTITMPAAPVDGMTITFSSTQAITSLTVNGNTGQSIVGAPTTLTAGAVVVLVYRLPATTWITQVNTNDTGATGVPVLRVYSTPGTWTKPATVKAIKVTVVGGGGGSGGCGPTAGGGGAGGGGGGGASTQIYPAPSLPGPQPYTVGTGGSASPSATAPGGTGSTSSFGVAPLTVISATGGSGGLAVTGGNISVAGGAGGAGSGGTFNSSGGGGGTGNFAPNAGSGGGGSGGSSIFGGGAAGFSNAGQAYGGGASGARGPGVLGAAGADGVIIVEEFY